MLCCIVPCVRVDSFPFPWKLFVRRLSYYDNSNPWLPQHPPIKKVEGIPLEKGRIMRINIYKTTQ